ncbi:universal stress protein [Nocardia wallacei]|uniref:universal stress protein n=1 Tax=Nocardia wallacei TaxID=480035 RepID=UPI0024575278|nr:universal stress protein [Nocardia wallacei]
MTGRRVEGQAVTEHAATGEADTDLPTVAAVDGSAVSYRAAAWAAADATLHNSRLHLVTSAALPPTSEPAGGPNDESLRRLQVDAGRVLEEARRLARVAASGEVLTISTEVTADPIIPHLIDRSRRSRIVAVGSRGRGALRRRLLGSVSSALARHAHCPVAVVHSSSATDSISASKPVLIGVDGSENSVPAIEFAFEEASRRKVGLVALHAWNDASAGLDAAIMGWDAIRGTEDAVLAESLAGYQERFPDVAVRRILAWDKPARALLDESDNAQLVVLGSHGRGGFAGMLLGSTSTALLQTVDCPIIVVRGPAKDAAGQ